MQDAPRDALPTNLIDPPWLRKPAAPKAVAAPAVAGLEPPGDRRFAWAPGEREQWWRSASGYSGVFGEPDWAGEAEKLRDGSMYVPTQASFLAKAPEALALPLLATWNPKVTWPFAHSLKPVAARFEDAAWEVSVRLAKANPSGTGHVLMPFLGADVARLMADWLYRLKSAQILARAWFRRHGPDAVPYLVPDALAKRVGPRRNAVHALRSIEGDVVEAARVHGDEAAEAVAALLADAPEETGPTHERPKPSPLPSWLDTGALPRPVLRDGGLSLPPDAARNLVHLWSMSLRSGEFPGAHEAAEEAAALCDPASLTAFAWALFEAWREAGMPGRSGFVMPALGRFGDDETVRRLTPLIKEWPGQSGHDRAVAGVGVLAGIGSDVALVHLDGIARGTRYKGLQRQAQAALRNAAERRGLTGAELADRLVPSFGLDASGSMVLDYGPRRFTVGFDEQLRPYVTSEDGKRRTTLPKPGAKDDPDLAPAAYKTFSALKKDVRTVASVQVARLETAMVDRRTWTPEEFTALFVRHPLIRHIARRLVWTADGAAFRIAEDGTLADARDEAFAPPGGARIGIAHPLLFGDTLATWAETFADYEITQPFPQLARRVLVLADGEGEDGRLARFEGRTVPFGKILGLTRTGWERGAAQDGGLQRRISRPAGDDHVVIDLDPGIAVGYVDLHPEQRITRVRLAPDTGEHLPGLDAGPFADVDPVLMSEILTDLENLM
ncbi:DUF4132 domain-containing protein [Actinomadura verrucosospora]|uniref:WGR domain-containing protein n=1 Tax=Actinomadura verrucosospora TaxID=46165 RepID=A0A7D3ZDP1_ACTVE|nr:DUF4132 domain-containing protein [Actinomadura verrucosospora]QKG20397.1 WGR domain-containing protein [Actinomadura verrucosospora]